MTRTIVVLAALAVSLAAAAQARAQSRLEVVPFDRPRSGPAAIHARLGEQVALTVVARDRRGRRVALPVGTDLEWSRVVPLRFHRDRARDWCESFVEVWTECSLDECKARDPKGLYARAERGEINDIAGWHQPYEAPEDSEVACATEEMDVEACADLVIAKLQELGYIDGAAAEEGADYSEDEEAQVEARLKDLGYL